MLAVFYAFCDSHWSQLYRNKYRNNKTVWNTARMTEMGHRNVKWDLLRENGTDQLPWCRVAISLQFFFLFKALSVECRKAKPRDRRCACVPLCSCLSHIHLFVICLTFSVSPCWLFLPVYNHTQPPLILQEPSHVLLFRSNWRPPCLSPFLHSQTASCLQALTSPCPPSLPPYPFMKWFLTITVSS